MPSLELLGWDGPSPIPGELADEGGRYATVLTYQIDATNHIVIVTLLRRGHIRLSSRDGVTAISMPDAMRAAVVFATNQPLTIYRDRDTMRSAIKAEIETSSAGWSPTALHVDGVDVDALERRVLDSAWAVVAELPDCYLAASGTEHAHSDELRFTVQRP